MLLPVNDAWELVDLDAPYPDLWVPLHVDIPLLMPNLGSYEKLNNITEKAGKVAKVGCGIPLVL
jgi:hypothetical protein